MKRRDEANPFRDYLPLSHLAQVWRADMAQTHMLPVHHGKKRDSCEREATGLHRLSETISLLSYEWEKK